MYAMDLSKADFDDRYEFDDDEPEPQDFNDRHFVDEFDDTEDW